MIDAEVITYAFNGRECGVTLGFDNLEDQIRALTIPAKWSSVVCLHDSKIEEGILNKLNHAAPLKFFPVKGGEEAKTPASLLATLETLLPQIDRKSLLIVIGGGTLGDMGGLCASLLMRGIDWVFIPSTLLAMVDSSIGGKTAINMDRGKNLVGTFYPPVHVLIDTFLLQTLSERELLSGYVELIKHALLKDERLFEELERLGSKALKEPRTLKALVSRSIQIKLAIINQDWFEKEGGQRICLNLGHTLGHALETALSKSRPLLHGEAVALGIAFEYRLARKMGLISQEILDRATHLFSTLGLTTNWAKLNLSPLEIKTLWESLEIDKKKNLEGIRITLPAGIGVLPTLETLPLGELKNFFAQNEQNP